jgi:transcriptional regulator of acetoin/glycerol metabolism/DNA-binding CsgD family transcriptional regulator
MARTEADPRDALSELLNRTGPASPVRAEIAESWRRVASSGIQPDHFEPTYDPDLDEAGRLERAARPVLNQLGDDLAGTETSLVLTDERAHIVGRRVSDRHLLARLDDILLAPGFFYDEAHTGTNGIGSALAQGQPVVVRGGEHFADALTDMACAGAPVTDPRSGEVLGVIDVTVRADHANSLMLPFARRAAWEIEQRLLEGASAIERVLHERFLQARKRAKGPLAVIGEYVMITNTAAARIVEPSDHARLWEWATRTIRSAGRSPDVVFANGTSITRCEPVHHGGVIVGALVWLRTAAPARDAALGWGSLTESERGVSGFVAQGLTNREIAAQLFLSHHTVDAHLRHIFRKLDIRSRVELARMAAEHGESRPAAAT